MEKLQRKVDPDIVLIMILLGSKESILPSGLSGEFYENDGFGKTLDRQQGLFATWQFSLFKNLMARLRVSEHRTLDSTKASIFIIPYDMGVHSFIGEGELQLLFLSFVFVCIMLLSYIPVYIYTLHSSMQVCILSIFSLPCFARS